MSVYPVHWVALRASLELPMSQYTVNFLVDHVVPHHFETWTDVAIHRCQCLTMHRMYCHVIMQWNVLTVVLNMSEHKNT